MEVLAEPVKKELVRILSPENISFEEEDILCYSYDATGRRALPECVLFPHTAEEVSLILKMANAEGIPVVPRGAGTGFTGGSLPLRGGIVMSTERMTTMEMDQENMTAMCGAGVVTWDLSQRAESLGLFYPPDPTSLKVSTIGGNIAECAGGPRGLKYGVTKDYVLALEVVLPTGEILKTAPGKTLKGVVGYNLTGLLTGSEGTLGVVTRAYLRLLPIPEEKRLLVATFDTLERAGQGVIEIVRGGVIPSALELIDGVCLKAVDEYAKVGLSGVGAAIIVEVDGTGGLTERDIERARQVCQKMGALNIEVAEEEKRMKELWGLRRAISPALKRVGSLKLNEDVVVPRTNIVELIRGLEDIGRGRDVTIASFGHAGDGNIHVNIMVDRDDPEEVERGEAAVKDLFELTLELGGTISGEHGVGVTKSDYIGMELHKDTLELMMRIKRAFDPNNILNPGKIFKEEMERV